MQKKKKKNWCASTVSYPVPGSGPGKSPALDGGVVSCHVRGIGIRCAHSSAAEVNPWALRVTYVSPDTPGPSVATAYTFASLGLVLRDGADRSVTDTLVLSCDESQREARAAYVAYVFTRNPGLKLPGQHAALVTVTLVSLLEKVYRKHVADAATMQQVTDTVVPNRAVGVGSVSGVFSAATYRDCGR